VDEERGSWPIAPAPSTLTPIRTSTIDVRMTGMAGPVRDVRRPATWAAVAVAAAVLALLAARADLATGGISQAATVADLAVGLAFVGGAALAPGSWRSRLLFAGVGLAWLLGTVVPGVRLVYLAVLAIALTTFPSGRPKSVRDWLLIVGSLLVATSSAAVSAVPPIPAMVAVFGAIAGTAWIGERWARAAAWAPAVSATAIALLLATSWLTETTHRQGYDSALWLLGLELVLIIIAAGFPIASWIVVRHRAMLADRLVGDERGVGIDGLATLLAETLGDPDLRIWRWDAAGSRHVTPDGSIAEVDEASVPIVVVDGDDRLATIVHRGSAAMDDPAIVAAVIEAVRLTALNERRQATQEFQLGELEAARGRLLVATDRQRAVTAARLRDEVVHFIEGAGAEIRSIDGARNGPEAREALGVAERELDASAGEILTLIGGFPPAMLGGGGLVEALGGLAARCPLPVAIAAAPDAIADSARETALFYVCSEALANAIKHAGANRISIDLYREDRELVVRIVDDGIGGARLGGFGLRGLADRLAAHGGRLRVDSPPGAGTTLTARIPD
jgi:signal transduction histidine kinase